MGKPIAELFVPRHLRAEEAGARELENVRLLPDDLDIIDQKRILREKIAELEKEDSDGHKIAA